MQILQDAPMKNHLWYQLGGTARYLLEAKNREDITEAIQFIQDKQIEKVFVCGLGANLIFTDGYFDGVVLQIVGGENKLYTKASVTREVQEDQFSLSTHRITAFGGEILDNLVVYSLQHSLSGLEWAGGLPGTIGAGVRGNVGAFGGEIKDTLLEAEVLSFTEGTPALKVMSNSELEFSYRTSYVKLHPKQIVISATFQLYPAVGETLEKAKETYLGNIMYRKTRHPLDLPNCGSVFKNIHSKEEVEKVLSVWPDVRESVETKWHGKVSMGYIVKRLGLSGKQIGGAQISDKHSNFILNTGNAKAADVIGLITEIQNKCEETFGFRPEVEVEIVR